MGKGQIVRPSKPRNVTTAEEASGARNLQLTPSTTASSTAPS